MLFSSPPSSLAQQQVTSFFSNLKTTSFLHLAPIQRFSCLRLASKQEDQPPLDFAGSRAVLPMFARRRHEFRREGRQQWVVPVAGSDVVKSLMLSMKNNRCVPSGLSITAFVSKERHHLRPPCNSTHSPVQFRHPLETRDMASHPFDPTARGPSRV